jgi:hypothetical protein
LTPTQTNHDSAYTTTTHQLVQRERRHNSTGTCNDGNASDYTRPAPASHSKCSSLPLVMRGPSDTTGSVAGLRLRDGDCMLVLFRIPSAAPPPAPPPDARPDRMLALRLTEDVPSSSSRVPVRLSEKLDSRCASTLFPSSSTRRLRRSCSNTRCHGCDHA